MRRPLDRPRAPSQPPARVAVTHHTQAPATRATRWAPTLAGLLAHVEAARQALRPDDPLAVEMDEARRTLRRAIRRLREAALETGRPVVQPAPSPTTQLPVSTRPAGAGRPVGGVTRRLQVDDEVELTVEPRRGHTSPTR